MLKELSLPAVFLSTTNRAIRATGIKQASWGRKALVLGLAALNTALLFAYILGVNNYASTGYEIKTLQNKISQISQENKKLILSISERASVSNLQAELSQSGYTVVKATTYLQDESQYSQR